METERTSQSDGAIDTAKPAAAPSGTGYRAIITRDSRVAWSCQHVHFTEHSARACAQRQVSDDQP